MLSRYLNATFWAAISIVHIVSCGPTPHGSCHKAIPASGIDVELLSKHLDRNIDIYIPGDSLFEAFTVRWSNLERPTPNVVVIPRTEKQVSKIVRFAHEHGVPILAYNGHHGSLTTLGRMKYGIAINLHQLNSFEMSKNKNTVTVGGGINSHNLTSALWAAGKQTVTGTCECVSYLGEKILDGPALGGGHGWLQGHHGLISDQFTSMNVVLANGELKTIDKDSDLWWGMLGAGHNFGIVTSVTAKIYSIEHSNWAIETIVFNGDKVEGVYEAANKHIIQGGSQSSDIINWSYWLNDATFDTQKPVIVMYVIQEGVDAVDSKYTQPFHDLGPIATTRQSGTYMDLGAWTNIALNSPPCQDFGFNNPRFPIYTKSYNTTAQRAAYELYASSVSGEDSPYYNSIFMFEDYATGGVRARGEGSTAFGFRSDLVLAAPLIIYNSSGEAEDKYVGDLGNRLREMIREGTGEQELHTYVNYAYGNEGPGSWYGHEDWRQKRLQALKTKYDPRGVFSLYAPIM